MLTIEPLVFSSWPVALAVWAIVIVGSIVQVGLGMGFGLTVAPVLALLDPALVPAAALFLGTATSVAGAASESSRIAWKEVGIGMVGRTSGIVAGLIVLLSLTDRSTFQLVFGCLIALAVILSVLGWRLSFTTINLSLMGVLSGFMGIITSVGAPPLALVYQNRDPFSARPTLAAFFALGGAISLSALYVTGWAGSDDFWLACFMAPAAILGTVIGRRWRGRFDTRYKPALLFIAAAASFLLILRGLS